MQIWQLSLVMEMMRTQSLQHSHKKTIMKIWKVMTQKLSNVLGAITKLNTQQSIAQHQTKVKPESSNWEVLKIKDEEGKVDLDKRVMTQSSHGLSKDKEVITQKRVMSSLSRCEGNNSNKVKAGDLVDGYVISTFCHGLLS